MTSSNSIVDRMSRIFRDVFEDETISLDDAMTSADIEGWDSLSHINLIYALEREFKIVFTIGEAGSALRNVGDLRALIEQKTSGKL